MDSLSNVRSFGNGHIFVQGGLVNNGIIYNAQYGFTIDLAGDLECNGTMFNSFISLDGAVPHHLRMGSGGDLETDLMLPEFGEGTLVVETDARISEGVALGDGGTMILEPGVRLELPGGSIIGGTLVTNGNAIHMEGNGYLAIHDVDDLDLSGSVRTYGPMSIAGNLRVAGTLNNWPFITSEITIGGDLVNQGAIRDTMQTLTLRLRGDAFNGGVWENQRVVVEGTEAQLVQIGSGIAVPEFVLTAGFTASSYQWTRDGAPIGGATSPELVLATVTPGDAGVYRCEGGEGQLSRPIDLSTTTTSVGEPQPNVPVAFALAPVRPNPLRIAGSQAAATIEFALPSAGHVSLAVFDVAGREVARPASGSFPAGIHRVPWVASGAAPGVYFVRLETAGALATRKVTLVK
jgi:hypothetical protein